jgi:hypothetical protein
MESKVADNDINAGHVVTNFNIKNVPSRHQNNSGKNTPEENKRSLN